MSTIRVGLSSLSSFEIVVGPSAGGRWGMRWGQRQPAAPENQRQPLGVTRRPRWVCCRSSSRRVYKEIARSVLFLSPLLATRQPPANDSDTSRMSQQDTS